MRIGELNKDNYMDYLKIFNIKSSESLDALWKSDEKNVDKRKTYIEPGMDITGRDPSSYKMVKVSDGIREKLVAHARSEFVNNFGKTDGEELSRMVKGYIKSVPVSERADAAWTLDQIFLDESKRISDLIKEKVPGWQPGQAFDQNVIRDLISQPNIDMKV